jgi:hypothetical protein
MLRNAVWCSCLRCEGSTLWPRYRRHITSTQNPMNTMQSNSICNPVYHRLVVGGRTFATSHWPFAFKVSGVQHEVGRRPSVLTESSQYSRFLRSASDCCASTSKIAPDTTMATMHSAHTAADRIAARRGDDFMLCHLHAPCTSARTSFHAVVLWLADNRPIRCPTNRNAQSAQSKHAAR